MKINSELPLCLLNKNEELNEFDFVLYHLYSSCEEYKNHFLNLRKTHPNRTMILDNSAYEYFIKGEELSFDGFLEAILELQPDYYILPDTLMDYNKTINGVDEFMKNYSYRITNSKPMAVLQGNEVNDFTNCASHYKSIGIEAICIPFHNSFLKEMGLLCDQDIQGEFMETYNCPVTIDMLYAAGRVQFVRNHEDLLKSFNYVHMLGSHCPLEKIFYKDFDSMDTGYPVKCAYVGDVLFEEKSKPNVIIDEFLYDDLDVKTKNIIVLNIEKFKKL
jgi:hypothetical protein